jgi:hypothetical protein
LELEMALPRLYTKAAADAAIAAAAVGGATSSGPDIAAVGDSLTAGAGDAWLGYPFRLQQAIDARCSTPGTVHNLGVGGETSQTITSCAGG